MNLLASLSYEKKNYLRTRLSAGPNKKCEIYEDTNLERSHRAFQSLSENAAYKLQIRTRLTIECSTKKKKEEEESVVYDNNFYNKISDASVKQHGAGNFVLSHVPAVWLSCAHRIQMSQSYTVAFVYTCKISSLNIPKFRDQYDIRFICISLM